MGRNHYTGTTGTFALYKLPVIKQEMRCIGCVIVVFREKEANRTAEVKIK